MLGDVAFGLLVLPEVLLPMLPDVPPEADDPVLEPYWRRQLSRSRPTRPMHWLGVDALEPAAASVLEPTPELVLPPTLEPVALGELVDPVLEPMLDPVLAPAPVLPDIPPDVAPVALLPDAPPEAPPAPPDCAHDAPATATNAAATAAAIALTITIESPWSVEQDCARSVARVVPGWLQCYFDRNANCHP